MNRLPKLFIVFVVIAAFLLTGHSNEAAKQALIVMTVNGPVNSEDIGVALSHEHFLVDFAGADNADRERYDLDEIFNVALPILKQLKELECHTLFECTPTYMGRVPKLYKRLSVASGLHIITNTGYSGAWANKFLPSYAFTESAGQLSERMITEWKKGIDDTGIRPGFIKITVDPGPLSQLHQKIVKSAAMAHLKSGLTIASHTGPAVGAFEQLEILKNEGVAASAFIWVHAQVEKDRSCHLKAARQGCWISFDGLRQDEIGLYLELLSNMKSAGLLDRVLLSHDAVCYFAGQPGGGKPFSFTRLFEELLPALRESGFKDNEIQQLLVHNPLSAYAVRIRKIE